MSRYDLPEDYAVSLLRQSVRDSLMSHGEPAIVLALYHVSTDENVQKRCPACWNDAYKQGGDTWCKFCWGTTFEGGVKFAARCWALFTDQDTQEESIGKHGVYAPDQRQVQIEYPPTLLERDFIVRVRRWRTDSIPEEIEGFYILGKPDSTSLRTGARFGQYDWDYAGTVAPVNEVQSDSHVITQYPIVGKTFVRLDGKLR